MATMKNYHEDEHNVFVCLSSYLLEMVFTFSVLTLTKKTHFLSIQGCKAILLITMTMESDAVFAYSFENYDDNAFTNAFKIHDPLFDDV